jgi:hypothetical protein
MESHHLRSMTTTLKCFIYIYVMVHFNLFRKYKLRGSTVIPTSRIRPFAIVDAFYDIL